MFSFDIYEIQRVDSELLSKRASRAYSQMPVQEDSYLARVVASVRALFGKQPEPVVVPVKANRTSN